MKPSFENNPITITVSSSWVPSLASLASLSSENSTPSLDPLQLDLRQEETALLKALELRLCQGCLHGNTLQASLLDGREAMH